MIRVMFVCLGNICRSPMAEAIFRHKVKQAGLEDKIQADSSGTSSYHVGERPHAGTQQVLALHGVAYSHRSQQITRKDLGEVDHLVAMDRENLRQLKRMTGPPVDDGKLSLLLDFAPQVERRDVPDPYYEGNFEVVYRLVEAGCDGLLDHLRRQYGL